MEAATPQRRAQAPRQGEGTCSFGRAADLRSIRYGLDGTWVREAEALLLRSPRGGLRLRFSAARLHLVAAVPNEAAIRVTVDGGGQGMITIGRPMLYTLLDGDSDGAHLLEIEANAPGLALFSVPFG